ncbi:uncharacterized protein LOC131065551 isoform X2 [Cryptomeria japonica]|uniref:uncharacterized protein LOC131065551 isoform X2 n=1 Tax=Cryptomeria japonica TaxID=3369 RepID=UPI0027DA1DCE|nr:uncharacterized protein LOC131065551 isoform X2 [Cryptomeria japonica]
MEIDEPKSVNFHVDEAEDSFLQFVASAQSMLAAGESDTEKDLSKGPPWSWVCTQILATCKAYSSGVTSAILLSDLHQAWQEQSRAESSKGKLNYNITRNRRQKQNRSRLQNTVMIDSIYEKKFLPLEGVLEAIIVNIFLLPGTSCYMLCLGDSWSSKTIDLYLHQKFYDLVQPERGVLRNGREIRLTGCRLRNTTGSGQPRLLPTEHLVILLDEDQDDDLMLLGAQFCSDSFVSISLDAVKAGHGVEKIGAIEVQGQSGRLKRRQIFITDNCGSSLEFIVWDEQILLSNLFSEGSWIALEKPFIAQDSDCGIGTSAGICLEYGSATRLYCVPYVYHEEEVILPSQNLTQLTRPLNISNCTTLECGFQGARTSQVLLRCDSQGSLDFSNFPFRLFVVDLRDKMSKFSLYGVVTFLGRTIDSSNSIFLLKIEDSTGSIIIKLNFNKEWSAGMICCGDTVFLSGLACYATSEGRLECSWHESNGDTSITNISQLPALLNSSCLHHISSLSSLSSQMNSTQVCRVLIERVELHQLNIELSHSHCGHSVNEEPDGLPICSFCLCVCDREVTPSFSFTVKLKDDSMELSAYCSGQSAAELLQVFPNEFCTWPEDEQAMYLYTIENDEFIVAICKNMCNNNNYQEAHNTNPDSSRTTWRITRALKCE